MSISGQTTAQTAAENCLALYDFDAEKNHPIFDGPNGTASGTTPYLTWESMFPGVNDHDTIPNVNDHGSNVEAYDLFTSGLTNIYSDYVADCLESEFFVGAQLGTSNPVQLIIDPVHTNADGQILFLHPDLPDEVLYLVGPSPTGVGGAPGFIYSNVDGSATYVFNLLSKDGNPTTGPFLAQGYDDPNDSWDDMGMHCWYGWTTGGGRDAFPLPSDPSNPGNDDAGSAANGFYNLDHSLWLTACFGEDDFGWIDTLSFWHATNSAVGGGSPSNLRVRAWKILGDNTNPWGGPHGVSPKAPMIPVLDENGDWVEFDLPLAAPFGDLEEAVFEGFASHITSTVGYADCYAFEFKAYGDNGPLDLDFVKLGGSISCDPNCPTDDVTLANYDLDSELGPFTYVDGTPGINDHGVTDNGVDHFFNDELDQCFHSMLAVGSNANFSNPAYTNGSDILIPGSDGTGGYHCFFAGPGAWGPTPEDGVYDIDNSVFLTGGFDDSTFGHISGLSFDYLGYDNSLEFLEVRVWVLELPNGLGADGLPSPYDAGAVLTPALDENGDQLTQTLGLHQSWNSAQMDFGDALTSSGVAADYWVVEFRPYFIGAPSGNTQAPRAFGLDQISFTGWNDCLCGEDEPDIQTLPTKGGKKLIPSILNAADFGGLPMPGFNGSSIGAKIQISGIR